MANTSSAKKAIRVAARKTVTNLRRKRSLKEAKKAVLTAVDAKDKKTAQSLLPKAFKEIDKAAKGKIINKNNAARQKSKLSARIASV